MAEAITLTSKVGRFVFKPDVILSHAKLIRDTVMAQILNPKPGLPSLRGNPSMEKIKSMFTDDIGGPISQVSFEFIPVEGLSEVIARNE
jgi:hypothetical protein